MPPEIALVVLTAAILANAGVMAAVVALGLWGRGPLSLFVRGRVRMAGAAPGEQHDVEAEAEAAAEAALAVRRQDVATTPTEIRSVTRGRQRQRINPAVQRLMRPSEDELDDVLKGRSAGNAYNRTIRIVSWAFIIACLVIVSATDLWVDTRPQIIAVLALGGIFVLVVHELMPPTGLGAARFVLEGTAAVVFLTLLVLLTGRSTSPFFFAYPLLVGTAALVATPAVTLILTAEAAAAFGFAAFGPTGAVDEPRTIAYVGINLTALALLAYAGLVISREQRRTRDAAIRLSTVDSLTDLFNRAFFFSTLDREIQRSRRYRREFCLLLMDLDGLKSINDRYGHYHGDLALKGVGHAINEYLRKADVAARYGGDEFVALLPETDRNGAFVVAEQIRQAVAGLVVEAGGQHVSTSISVGIVSFPQDGQTADELMIAGDEAMYSSKRLGKNRVVAYGEAQQAAARQPVAAPAFVPGGPNDPLAAALAGHRPAQSGLNPTAARPGASVAGGGVVAGPSSTSGTPAAAPGITPGFRPLSHGGDGAGS